MVSRAVIGRLGGLTRAAMYDGKEMTAAARDAAFARFEQMVDPEGQLSPEERRRRALAAQKAHMTRIAMKSVEARQRKKARR